MQSGRGKTHEWVLEYEPGRAQKADGLMGWVGGGDTHEQIRLRFKTRDEAVAYAKKERIDFHVAAPRERLIRPKNYSDNFRFDRVR